MAPDAGGFIPSPAHGTHPHRAVPAARVRPDARDRRARRGQDRREALGATGHDPKEIGEIVVPVVIAGVIGARVYHLFTGYKWSEGGIVGTFEIWKGGLSIWGAVAGGADRRGHRGAASAPRHARAARRDRARASWSRRRSAAGATTSTRSCSVGRRKLPWALEIDLAHRPAAGYEHVRDVPSDVPLRVDLVPARVRHDRLGSSATAACASGQAFALYVAMYTFGRIFFECAAGRPGASKIFGIRFNLLLSAVLCASAPPSGSSGSGVDATRSAVSAARQPDPPIDRGRVGSRCPERPTHRPPTRGAV